jgi:hypothetical protein
MQGQILFTLEQFGAWPIASVQACDHEHVWQLVESGKLNEFVPGWVCLSGSQPSLHQLGHYYLSAQFFSCLERSNWLLDYRGELHLRANRRWPFVPDGTARVFDGSTEHQLVIEVMRTRREYSQEKVCWILKSGAWPVFVVGGAGEQALQNLQDRVGPLAAIVTAQDLKTGHWMQQLRKLWI